MAATKKKTVAANAKRKKFTFDLARVLLAMPKEAAKKTPSMPVRVAQLEGERLWAVAKPSRAKFVALEDFPADDFDSIPYLLDALAEAETDWQRKRVQARAKGLVVARKDAEKARHVVMNAGRYRLRKNAAAQTELDRIDEGEGLPDLIQDLKDAATFTETHAAVLERDPKITKDTPQMLRALATTLSEGEGDSEVAITAMEHRNKVFAALEAALGEVRAAAGYLYWDDAKRLQPYLSQYEAKQRRATRQAKSGKAKATAS